MFELSVSWIVVVPVAVAPTGRWPSAAAITEFGTTHCAESPRSELRCGGCERTVRADEHVDLRDRVARQAAHRRLERIDVVAAARVGTRRDVGAR